MRLIYQSSAYVPIELKQPYFDDVKSITLHVLSTMSINYVITVTQIIEV